MMGGKDGGSDIFGHGKVVSNKKPKVISYHLYPSKNNKDQKRDIILNEEEEKEKNKEDTTEPQPDQDNKDYPHNQHQHQHGKHHFPIISMRFPTSFFLDKVKTDSTKLVLQPSSISGKESPKDMIDGVGRWNKDMLNSLYLSIVTPKTDIETTKLNNSGNNSTNDDEKCHGGSSLTTKEETFPLRYESTGSTGAIGSEKKRVVELATADADAAPARNNIAYTGTVNEGLLEVYSSSRFNPLTKEQGNLEHCDCDEKKKKDDDHDDDEPAAAKNRDDDDAPVVVGRKEEESTEGLYLIGDASARFCLDSWTIRSKGTTDAHEKRTHHDIVEAFRAKRAEERISKKRKEIVVIDRDKDINDVKERDGISNAASSFAGKVSAKGATMMTNTSTTTKSAADDGTFPSPVRHVATNPKKRRRTLRKRMETSAAGKQRRRVVAASSSLASRRRGKDRNGNEFLEDNWLPKISNTGDGISFSRTYGTDHHVDKEDVASIHSRMSTVVRLHGLPVGCKPEQVTNFFSGLVVEKIFILLTWDVTMEDLDDAAMEPRGRVDEDEGPIVLREPSTFRVFVKFDSAAAASLAVERTGETMTFIIKEGGVKSKNETEKQHEEEKKGRRKDTLKKAFVALLVTPVRKRIATFLLRNMAIDAVRGTSMRSTLKKTESRLPENVIEILWTMTSSSIFSNNSSLPVLVDSAKKRRRTHSSWKNIMRKHANVRHMHIVNSRKLEEYHADLYHHWQQLDMANTAIMMQSFFCHDESIHDKKDHELSRRNVDEDDKSRSIVLSRLIVTAMNWIGDEMERVEVLIRQHIIASALGGK